MKEIEADYFLSYFEMLEDRIIEFQKIIPFCRKHKNVHSPILTGIINESCNLLDSLFYTYYSHSGKTTSQPNIKDYKKFYNPPLLLHKTKTVLFVTPPQYCMPFKEWSKKNISPKWWAINNKLKHEMVGHINNGTYISAIHALCALHQSIVKIVQYGYDPTLGKIILRHNWIKSDIHPDFLVQSFDHNPWNRNVCIVETKLFATPMGDIKPGGIDFPNNISKLSPDIFNAPNSRLSYFLGRP